VAFATDDLTAWLIGMLADVGRGKLADLVFGSKLERALSSATREAVRQTAEEVYPEDQQRAGAVELAIAEVFGVRVPAGSLARGETTLELLRAGVARQLAVLDDQELTGTGQSSADVLGVRAGVLAEKLADHLVSAIIAGGSRGGPLFPLSNQLNHDLTHLNLGLRADHPRLRGDEDAAGSGRARYETRASQFADSQPPLFTTATVGSTLYRSDDWIVDVPLDELTRWNSSGPPAGVDRLQMWAFQHHLQSADNNCLELTVEGRTAQAVVLKQVRFLVLNRRPGSVPRGVRLDLSSLSLGASLNVRNFEVDLGSADVAVPAPMPLHPYDSELTPDFPYVVHRTDPEQFYFSLDYGDEDIEWVAELDWLSAGRSGSVRIDDDGAPFASTAFRSRPVYIWNGSRQVWRDHLCASEGCYRNHHRSRK
jgi:hypothetical protein